MRRDRGRVEQLDPLCGAPSHRSRGHQGVCGEDHQEGLDPPPDRADAPGEGHHLHSAGGHRVQLSQPGAHGREGSANPRNFMNILHYLYLYLFLKTLKNKICIRYL